MGLLKSLRQRVQAASNPRSEPGWELMKIDHPRDAESAQPMESAGMQRHPYIWSGIDRDGNPKSGQTLMRDKTVLVMADGFMEAGYQQLTISRDGVEIVGIG